jgi:hypothetical protein
MHDSEVVAAVDLLEDATAAVVVVKAEVHIVLEWVGWLVGWLVWCCEAECDEVRG